MKVLPAYLHAGTAAGLRRSSLPNELFLPEEGLGVRTTRHPDMLTHQVPGRGIAHISFADPNTDVHMKHSRHDRSFLPFAGNLNLSLATAKGWRF